MNIIEKRVKDLKPYEKNPRLNDDAVKYVAESISQFGFRVPIVIDKDNNIVCGHTRWKACKKLKIDTVPCVVADDLTEEQIRAYRLADNRVAEKAEWDLALLDTELAEIETIDMTLLGFDDKEEETPQEVVEDEFEGELPEEPKSKYGDIYQCGDHRVMCGDATKTNDVECLMGGHIADICVTSPPYNAGHLDVALSQERGGGFNKSTQKKYLNDDDTKTNEEYNDFLCANIDTLLMYSKEIFYNIGVGAGSKSAIANILSKYVNNFKELMYWKKENPMPVIVESVVSSAVELIICLGQNGSRSFEHFNDRMFHGVISGNSASNNKYADIHKATFPIYLPSEIIKRFTDEDGMVLDCFGGTGTTMMACEQLNRKCFMMELEPRYVDVIINRWETFTGEKAVKINAD